MAHIVQRLDTPSTYQDRSFKGRLDDELAHSSTLYVGNLSFFTTEEQIYKVFSKCGEIKRIIMGLDRHQKTPCGFCFVEYYSRESALNCLRYVSGTKLDERIIRCDLDYGYREGRQFGRGRSGGQVRDEFRTEFDAGRGGWGHYVKQTGQMPTPQGQQQFKRQRRESNRFNGSNGEGGREGDIDVNTNGDGFEHPKETDAYGDGVVDLSVNNDVPTGSKRKMA